MDQPGKVGNPAHGQLNRENQYFPVPVAPENLVSLDGFVRESPPTSACPFSIPWLNLVLTCGIPPEFRGGVHLFLITDSTNMHVILASHLLVVH